MIFRLNCRHGYGLHFRVFCREDAHVARAHGCPMHMLKRRRQALLSLRVFCCTRRLWFPRFFITNVHWPPQLQTVCPIGHCCDLHSLVALMQEDMKKPIAYSSVAWVL